jgi:hypothetical protein
VLLPPQGSGIVRFGLTACFESNNGFRLDFDLITGLECKVGEHVCFSGETDLVIGLLTRLRGLTFSNIYLFNCTDILPTSSAGCILLPSSTRFTDCYFSTPIMSDGVSTAQDTCFFVRGAPFPKNVTEPSGVALLLDFHVQASSVKTLIA